MNQPASYDDDFLAWSEQQAAALRGLADSRRDLPNELDAGRVAEDIEDVGRAELNTVKRSWRTWSRPDPAPAPARHWRTEVVAFHSALLDQFSPSMACRLERRAMKEASAALANEGSALARGRSRDSRRWSGCARSG